MAGRFISGASFLFITFGTARVFRWNKTGKIVSNCHKIPSAEFSNELLSVNEIVILWSDQLEQSPFSVSSSESCFYNKSGKALERWSAWQSGKQIGLFLQLKSYLNIHHVLNIFLLMSCLWMIFAITGFMMMICFIPQYGNKLYMGCIFRSLMLDSKNFGSLEGDC